MKINIILSVLALTSTLFSQTKIEVSPLFTQTKAPDIKGFTLGMTMEQSLILKMGKDEYTRELAMCRESQGMDFYWGTTNGNPNITQVFLGTAVGSKQKQITIAGQKANIVGRFKVESPKSQSILFVVYASFSNSVSDAVFEGLVEKYGNPTSKELVEKSNRMGTKFSGVTAIWKIGNRYTILFDSIGNNVNESSITISDDFVAEQVSKIKNPLSKDI